MSFFSQQISALANDGSIPITETGLFRELNVHTITEEDQLGSDDSEKKRTIKVNIQQT